jgi:rSAM/selenodomain-associated transferase 2
MVQLSVIIPTLDEARGIADTLDAVARVAPGAERIVVDGGSSDDTVARARAAGAVVVTAPRGRGRQLAVGAAHAHGDVLWFVHADAVPPEGAALTITRALDDTRVVAGCFDVRFGGPRQFAAGVVTWAYRGLRLFGVTYGDSAFFVKKSAYDSVGGFPDWTLFEDYALWKKLRAHGRVVEVESAVVASSRRFEGRSFVVCFARWCTLQILYWLGASPEWLARRYAPVRERASLHE